MRNGAGSNCLTVRPWKISEQRRNLVVAPEQQINRGLRELALFAGAGGGILGGTILGWRTVCAVELNAYCARRLMQRQDEGHLPPFPIWDDVCTFNGRPWRGVVDVVSGGFPCQDKGAGITGPKSGLWNEMARIVREVGPEFVFVENVPALLVRGFGVVLGDLAKMGYAARWGVLGGEASDACVESKRLWVVASAANGSMLESLDFSAIKFSCEEGSCRRQFTRAVGAMLRPDDYAAIKRDPDAVARGMEQFRAIGNGQIPGVAARAWRILAQ